MGLDFDALSRESAVLAATRGTWPRKVPPPRDLNSR